MSAELNYNGDTWQLADGIERSACQAEIMRLCGTGGGIAEFKLQDGRTIGLLFTPSIPVAIVDGHESAYVRLT